MTEIPLPSALVRAPVTWTLGHADATGPLKAARGFVRFDASAIAVAYSDRTVLPSPVETPFVAGVMTPVDLIVNDPDIWNWKVTVKAGGVTWDPFHINVPAEGTNLASASITPGKGPVKVLKGDRGAQGASLDSLEQIADDTLRAVIHDPLTGVDDVKIFDLPRGPEGPYGGTEVTDPQVASLVSGGSTTTRAALDAATVESMKPVAGASVRAYGVVGDGTTDDTAAMQDAVDDMWQRGGGRLVCDPGMVIRVHRVTARSRVQIDLQGATLRANTALTTNLIESAPTGRADGFTLSNGTIDMNGLVHRAVYLAAAKGAVLAFLSINGVAGGIVSKTGIFFGPNTESCVAEYNTITMPREEVPVEGTSYVGISCSSTLADSQSGGRNSTLAFQEPTEFSQRHTIRYNRLIDGTHGISLAGAREVKITHNETTGQSHRGIILSPRAASNTISFNILRDFVSTGIHLAWGSIRNTIMGNDLATGRSGTEGDGIKGYFGCSDNTVTGNIVQGAANGGIRFAVGSMDNTISGNRLIDCASGVLIQSLLGGAYYQPANLPETIGGTIAGNDISAVNRPGSVGIQLEAGGAFGVRRQNISGNTGKVLAIGVKVVEAQNFTIDGVAATGNDWDAVTRWDIPRGNSHFTVSVGNRGLTDIVSDSGRLFRRRAEPSGLGSQDAVMYTRANGAGKTELVVKFSNAAPQIVATQP